jgi:hypothetical protein
MNNGEFHRRRATPAGMVVVDEACRPFAFSPPGAGILAGLWDEQGVAASVREAFKALGPQGGSTILKRRIALRITPLAGAVPLWILRFEEFRTRAEDRLD